MKNCKECPAAYHEDWNYRVVVRCGAEGPRKGYVIAAPGVPAWCPRRKENDR